MRTKFLLSIVTMAAVVFLGFATAAGAQTDVYGEEPVPPVVPVVPNVPDVPQPNEPDVPSEPQPNVPPAPEVVLDDSVVVEDPAEVVVPAAEEVEVLGVAQTRQTLPRTGEDLTQLALVGAGAIVLGTGFVLYRRRHAA